MGKCVICGKKGLFLKLDSHGRCNSCIEIVKLEEKKNEEREVTNFETFYYEILQSLKLVRESIKFGQDPIEALSLIPLCQERLELCSFIQTQLHNPRFEKKMFKRLLKSITYDDDFDQRYGIGMLKDWEISVFADVKTKSFTQEKIFADIDKQLNSYKYKWNSAIKSINNSAEFQRAIDAIPSTDVLLSNSTFSKLTVSKLEDLIKYTNVTAKTSFDKIGSFVVVDTETTGLSSTKDNIIEVAAIRFEDWIPVAKFYSLINPEKHIPDDASAVNGIIDEMVASAPKFAQIIDSLSDFVGKSSLVGHNLPFDLKFIYHQGYDFTSVKRRYYDTCEIAKKTLKKPKMKWDKEFEEYVINDNYDYDVDDYKLTTLCDYYGIRDNTFAHRALSDALATGYLFMKLAQDKIDI